MKSLVLPKNATLESIETEQSILFIGGNGCGKTRLGAWIELGQKQNPRVHRISAQKSLSMPDSATPMSIEIAERNLLFGHTEREDLVSHYRWGQKPATSLLNDFEKLMAFLFSDETEENAKLKASCLQSNERVVPPQTRLDLVKKVWETVLPHRELVIGGLRIETKIRGKDGAKYNSSEMSDGERVIFYLIGQCLAAPKDSVIVIDEPELHLHKSIQLLVWREIERLRPDCLFVYFSHDVDFAAGKKESVKIWIKAYDGIAWDWEKIEQDANLPDELLFELLGARKPVLFVEGENGKVDVSLYRAVFSEYIVVPRGSCDQVIHSVKSLKANAQFHHLSVYGLIDRDRRVEAEIERLWIDSIYVLDVAEVENLFCTREILKIVSERLSRDAKADFETVSKAVFNRLRSELDTQVTLHTVSEIKFRLNCFDEKVTGSIELDAALNNLIKGIDVQKLYDWVRSRFESAIQNNDYELLLRLYNRKSLSSQASLALGLKADELPNLVVRIASTDGYNSVRTAILKFAREFAVQLQ